MTPDEKELLGDVIDRTLVFLFGVAVGIAIVVIHSPL